MLQPFATSDRLSPKTISLHVNLGYVLRSQGKLDEALQRFQTALSLNSKHPQFIMAWV
ncbi:tetratricopeptide repeat protein [bacterium]|nr:tetratricopeptide repeat protein [bacterium]